MLEKNDHFSVSMIERLGNALKNDVRKVILHGDDDKHFSGLTESQIKSTGITSSYLKALKIASDSCKNEESIT